MQSPLDEIPGVVKSLVQAKDADEQLAAIRRYFSPDASFDHMLCAIPSGPQSRDNGITPVYQWLRQISTSTIRVTSVGEYKRTHGLLVPDVSELTCSSLCSTQIVHHSVRSEEEQSFH